MNGSFDWRKTWFMIRFRQSSERRSIHFAKRKFYILFFGPFLWQHCMKRVFWGFKSKETFYRFYFIISFYHLNLFTYFYPWYGKKVAILPRKVYYFNHFVRFSIFYQNIRRLFQKEKHLTSLKKFACFFLHKKCFCSRKFFPHLFMPIQCRCRLLNLQVTKHVNLNDLGRKIKFDNLKWSAIRVSWFCCLIRFQRNWYRVCLVHAHVLEFNYDAADLEKNVNVSNAKSRLMRVHQHPWEFSSVWPPLVIWKRIQNVFTNQFNSSRVWKFSIWS